LTFLTPSGFGAAVGADSGDLEDSGVGDMALVEASNRDE
jgi:hypothetical protein